MFKNHIYIFFLIIFCVLITSKYTNAGCRFEYEGDYPTIPSVLLTDFSELLKPEYDPIKLNLWQAVIVACPGSNNVIKKLNVPYAIAFCTFEKTLFINCKNYQFSELGCKKNVQSECRITGNACGSGVLVDIGYKITNYYTPMVPLYQICYDSSQEIPLYAHHQIYGATISHAKGSTSRPNFKAGCFPFSITQKQLDDAYTQDAQLKRFEEIFSSKELAQKYIAKYRSYLAKGHLNADGDQVLNTSTTATYLYINTVPMWQQINNGNWKSLEYSIRNYAQFTKDNFEIVTGAHDILGLPNSRGVEQNIYLAGNNKIAVPKYIWKIIYSTRTKSGIGFIALNNPFYANLTMNVGCRNICDEQRWGTDSWKDPKRGLLYCCSIDELQRFVRKELFSFTSNIYLLRGLH